LTKFWDAFNQNNLKAWLETIISSNERKWKNSALLEEEEEGRDQLITGKRSGNFVHQQMDEDKK
jgi:hypothetical protein